MPPIRILLVESYALLRDGVRALLEREEDLCWVGEAADAETAVRLATELKPDIILMALQLAEGDATAAMQEITATLPQTRIITLTSLQDDDSIAAAIRSGTVGYILKHASAAELLQAIRFIAAGGAVLDPRIAPRMIARFRQLYLQADPPLTNHLNERELMILKLLATGRSNREIADALHLSEQTVKNALTTLYQKLDVRKRTEAVVAAMRLGVLPRRP